VEFPIEDEFIVDGFHVPAIEGVLDVLVGRLGATLFWHNGPSWLNKGVIKGLTIMNPEAVTFPQPPTKGME
jgi:hypothetical protein